MSKMNGIEMDKSLCIPTCTSTCKKGINNNAKLQEENMGAAKIENNFESLNPLHKLSKFSKEAHSVELNTQISEVFKSTLFASHHLTRAEQYVPDEILSKKNFDKIRIVSELFPSNLTTFLGFETRLGEPENVADFAFAISGLGKDREILLKMLEDNQNAKKFLKHSEWHQIKEFANAWANPNSELYNKVQCFWLEFDMPSKDLQEMPVPSVFFGPTKNYDNFNWLTRTAIPLLKGDELSKKTTELVNACLSKIPKNSNLFQVGTMLSRDITTVRLHINKIKPDQIIPYLKDIGYKYETKELSILVNELTKLADRFVISYDITDNGIGEKIGIELSFTGDKFQNEHRWENLMDYLVEKEICIPEKRDALLNYQGAEYTDEFSGGIMKPICSATDYSNDLAKSNVVRYINHIKIVYQPDKKLIAKAYPAVRLFENKQ